MRALLTDAARGLRRELKRGLSQWNGEPGTMEDLVTAIADVYDRQGYARLAVWLSLSGYEAPGTGLFDPLVDALHRVAQGADNHKRVTRRTIQEEVALLNVVLAGEPLLGQPFLQSVGLESTEPNRERLRRRVREACLRRLVDSVWTPGHDSTSRSSNR